jgi:hypothetical protein
MEPRLSRIGDPGRAKRGRRLDDKNAIPLPGTLWVNRPVCGCPHKRKQNFGPVRAVQ